MTETRTVALNLSAVAISNIRAVTGAESLFVAIGYLSQWNMTFPHVTITGHGGPQDSDPPELVATYRRDPTGPIAYVLGAIYNRDTGAFSFHS